MIIMALLRSARGVVASWEWLQETPDGRDLTLGVSTAVKAARVLGAKKLMEARRIEISWDQKGKGPIGLGSTISIPPGERLEADELAARIADSQPRAHPESRAYRIYMTGPGAWIDEQGNEKWEPRLVDFSVDVQIFGVTGVLGVIHDIWSWYDFSGDPHPLIHQNNAPRLAAAIKEIEDSIGVEVEPGEPTFYAEPERYGIKYYPPNEEGQGFNAAGLK
ncbi:hypothetical protein ACOQFV_17635 [Nocardiopsis changdeensis]|uniref:Uncharacterized protein n=1 Tax=Nocardiopsis changdeensis TaxID=2831969 RepID=A0ABX8BP17_9ACTN|nr:MULTISPECIES: hypothetical protein [Nocardiopsis]QUX23989.1 hypothetical protein KGD84_06585 [Nocardiopsis changdeensis]QYX39934.1 hypothetical protein K1J57_16040 [Nocardiopsis sp. MT53]